MATILGMSKKWVYDHWAELGGSKIGGTIFFTQEGLKNALQRGSEMEGNTETQGIQGKNKALRNQTRSLRVGTGREKSAEKDRLAAGKRHGLINDVGEIP